MHNKSVKLDSTFLPKRKRVLNKPAKKTKVDALFDSQKVDAHLDSQLSFSSVKRTKVDALLDSQLSFSSVKRTKVDTLFDSQLSFNSCFVDSQGCALTSPVSIMYAINLSLPKCAF